MLDRIVSALALLPLAVTALGCESPPAPFSPERTALFDAALEETHASQHAVGTTMIVSDGEGHRWVGVAGDADLSGARPVTEDTLFLTASIAKTFTGALILSLHEEGRLSIEAPLSDYVDLVPNGDAITLGMLMRHTSGIANYTKVPAYREATAADPGHAFTYTELVELAVAEGPQFDPGTEWDYCNTGYILLGMIAESIVGRPLFEEIQSRFLEPLGMHDTRPVGSSPPPELWVGYSMRDGEWVEGVHRASYAADGGWVTSLDDMVAWARAFLGGRLHQPATLELAEMTAGGALLDTVAQSFGFESGGYGLGMIVASDDTLGTLRAGAGNGDGVRSFVGYFPARDVAFAVSVNVGDSSVPIVESISAAGPILDALRAAEETP